MTDPRASGDASLLLLLLYSLPEAVRGWQVPRAWLVQLPCCECECWFMVSMRWGSRSELCEQWEVVHIWHICDRNGWVKPTVYQGTCSWVCGRVKHRQPV